MEAQNFYKWWTLTVKGNHIPDQDFERVLERFDNKPDLKIINSKYLTS